MNPHSGQSRHSGSSGSKPIGSDTVTRLFDGHQDILSQLSSLQVEHAALELQKKTRFHLDLDKCRRGNYGASFFAMWVPSTDIVDDFSDKMRQATYDLPLPEPLDQQHALSVVLRQASLLLELQQQGVVQICTDLPSLKHWLHRDKLAAVMHLEGCEALDENLYALDVLHAAGLRSLGPVWSRNTIFGCGVPFRYPSTPDIGPGLSSLGIELVRRCNQLGILIDLSHLNQSGFNDVARHSTAPLVATHSNAHKLCPHARNLLDEQLEMIKASNGVVGLNFACAFLRSDGRMDTNTSMDQLLRHLDYLLDKLGETGVAIGSDFDGADVPDVIGDAAGVPLLMKAMKSHGYDDTLVQKISHGNWLGVLERIWC